MIVDGHTHIFSADTGQYPLADITSYRPVTDGSVELLKARMEAAGVDRAFTIPPWIYGWDQRYGLDSLANNRSWLALGVMVEPRNPKAPELLAQYVCQGACGLRIQGCIIGQDPLDDPATTPLWSRAAELGIPVDVNATHEEYAQVETRVRAFPDLRILLDHCGYISPNLAPRENTVAPVLLMARYPNVYAKLSFVALASQDAYPFADVHWMVREIIDAFGPERCLYGSNFPTAQYNPRMTYDQTATLFAEAIDLSEEERAWVLGGTAEKLWRWEG